ncbi:MAG TPA: hypothetical protein DCY27_12660 [Desulfobacterales bacterium]|nr:hypothetical protein [Desulfobacterales bacterium]
MMKEKYRSLKMHRVNSFRLFVLSCLVLVLIVVFPGWAAEQAFILDGTLWQDLSYDARITYVKGVCNMADFECQIGGAGRGFCVAKMLVEELKAKAVGDVVKDIDQYYQENPEKIKTSVLEVMVRRATKLCPPEPTK